MTYTKPRHARSADQPVRAAESPESEVPDDVRALYDQRVDQSTRELYFQRVDDNSQLVQQNTQRIEEHRQRVDELEREVERIKAIADSLHDGMFGGGGGSGGRPVFRVIRGGKSGPTVVAFDSPALRERIERWFTKLHRQAQLRPVFAGAIVAVAVIGSLLFAKIALLADPVASTGAAAVQQHRRRALVQETEAAREQASSAARILKDYDDDDLPPPMIRLRGAPAGQDVMPILILLQPSPSPVFTPMATSTPSASPSSSPSAASPSPSGTSSPSPSTTTAPNGSTPAPSPS